VIPPLVERTEVAFAPEEPADGRWRFMAGLGVTLAVGIASEPGVILVFALLVLGQLVAGRSRGRGLGLIGGGALCAAFLVFPFVPSLVAGDGRAVGSMVGTVDLARLGRLAIGPGPGTWLIAAFLPLAAIFALSLVGPGQRARAMRMAVVAAGGLALAWLSAAGWLPAALANAPVYVVVAAAAEAMVVSLGLASVLGVARESFGARQIGTAALAVVLAAGLSLQALSAMTGGWAWGGLDKIPAAWAVVDGSAQGGFNVLWLGGGPDPFPAPGGDPQGSVAAGQRSVTYAITGRGGASVLDTGRPLAGPGADALRAALAQIVAGRTLHGGALLAPFGVRYVVAATGALPAAALARLKDQVDMDPTTANGLVIYRDSASLPPAGALSLDPAAEKILATGDLSQIAQLPVVAADPLAAVRGGWDGSASAGQTVYIATEFSANWREGTQTAATKAFGWATAFPNVTGPVHVRDVDRSAFQGFLHTLQLWVLGALWLVALWVTRKPVIR
jgi:hypothetical protein